MTKETNNVIDHPNRYSNVSERPEKKKPNYLARRLGAGAAVLITAASGYGIIKSSMDYMNSEETPRDIPTQTETLLPGETVWDKVDEVENVVDKRTVITWAENNSPDLADGVANVGDEVILPVDVEDIE